MKLLSLKIQGYKNLIDDNKVSINFSDCTTYTALIGLNGSGKSNVLEAVSMIFSNLYHQTDLPEGFKYHIVYEIDGGSINITDGKMTVTEPQKPSTVIKKADYSKYLPNNVITSYSGEELRMWEKIYIESYVDFFKDIKKQTADIPKLLYVNKYCWEFALITLLSSDNPTIKSFVKDTLKIGEDVEVQFTIDENNYGTYPNNDALALIKRFVKLQKESANNSIPIQTIASLDLKQQNNTEFTQKLFYYLFITGMPVKSNKVNAEKIIRNTEIKFNGLDVKKLSEGEKKLILIYTITHILSDNKTLVLLDEPDAHIHIERKKDIIDIIDKEDCFTLFTTHSPTILKCVDDKNIRLIKNVETTGVEVLNLNKTKSLEELTNGEFSIIDATLALSTTKDILLVEGTNDYKYIKEAIKKLAPEYDDYDFHIINCGGAGNVPTILEESLLQVLNDNQLCLCTFDYDEKGRENYDKILKIAQKEGKSNLKAMYHTKLDGTPHINNIDFYMEDYFPINTYRQKVIDDINGQINIINSKTGFGEIEGFSLQYKKPKKIIKDKYTNLPPADYENFRVLLDETLRIKGDFHNQQQTTS